MKGQGFQLSNTTQCNFELLKKTTKAPILALPSYCIVFQVVFDESAIAIGVILSMEGRPIVYFERLNEARRKLATYDLEFYAIV